MATKKVKDKVNKVFNQAKDTVKLLESLNLLESAKTFVKIPEAQKEKALSTLRKLGVATQDEVEALRTRIEKLEAALIVQAEKSASSQSETSTSV